MWGEKSVTVPHLGISLIFKALARCLKMMFAGTDYITFFLQSYVISKQLSTYQPKYVQIHVINRPWICWTQKIDQNLGFRVYEIYYFPATSGKDEVSAFVLARCSHVHRWLCCRIKFTISFLMLRNEKESPLMQNVTIFFVRKTIKMNNESNHFFVRKTIKKWIMGLIFMGLCNVLTDVDARWKFCTDTPSASAVFKWMTWMDPILSLYCSSPKANFDWMQFLQACSRTTCD